jgi:hypothetical protein
MWLANCYFADNPLECPVLCDFVLSARRATQVLQFFHDCQDCDYDREAVRPRLVLSGLGNKSDSGADPGERRVDVVLDYANGLQ